MDLDILRLDLDIPSQTYAIAHLQERLSYCNDVGFINIENIDRIILIKKKTYGCKIFLKIPLSSYNNVVLLESILGCGWRKCVNSLINYFLLDMKEYPNRLFDVKRYKGGKVRKAISIDVTEKISSYVLNAKRKKFKT